MKRFFCSIFFFLAICSVVDADVLNYPSIYTKVTYKDFFSYDSLSETSNDVPELGHYYAYSSSASYFMVYYPGGTHYSNITFAFGTYSTGNVDYWVGAAVKPSSSSGEFWNGQSYRSKSFYNSRSFSLKISMPDLTDDIASRGYWIVLSVSGLSGYEVTQSYSLNLDDSTIGYTYRNWYESAEWETDGDPKHVTTAASASDLDVTPDQVSLKINEVESVSVSGSTGSIAVESADPGICKVSNITDSSFDLTGIASGNTTITVSDGENDASVSVTVEEDNPSDLSIEPSSLSIVLDETNTDKINVSGATGDVTVSSANENIATASFDSINNTVTVTGIAEGKTTITITDGNSTKYATVNVFAAAEQPLDLPDADDPANGEYAGDLSLAPVYLGSFSHGGDEFELTVNFPPYSQSVDHYAGVKVPGIDEIFYINTQDSLLSTAITPLSNDVEQRVSLNLMKVFSACAETIFGYTPVLPTGIWEVYWLTVPSGSLNLFEEYISLGDKYSIGWYDFSFDGCPSDN